MKSLNKSCVLAAKDKERSFVLLPTSRLIEGEGRTCFRKEKENLQMGKLTEMGKITHAIRSHQHNPK